MEGEHFFEWFEKIFVPFVKNIPGWKVLFFDGHHSHISLKLVELAVVNFFILIVLPPNSTQLLQPLDGAPFKKGKHGWKVVIEEHLRTTKMLLMKRVLEMNFFDRLTAISAFEKCGIFPLE